MKLNNEWELTSDAYNVVLVKYGLAEEGKNAGKMVEREKYFYPTIEKACLALVRKQLNTADIDTILTTITQSTTDIIAATKHLKKEAL